MSQSSNILGPVHYDRTLVLAIELSSKSWVLAAQIPGLPQTELVSERVGLVNRIVAVLATLGAGEYNPLLQNRCHRLAELRTGLGACPSNHLDGALSE